MELSTNTQHLKTTSHTLPRKVPKKLLHTRLQLLELSYGIRLCLSKPSSLCIVDIPHNIHTYVRAFRLCGVGLLRVSCADRNDFLQPSIRRLLTFE